VKPVEDWLAGEQLGGMTIALLFPSEFAAPGAGRVKVATLLTTSLIVPPFSAREFVAT
jgi:hypothetical protein